MIELPKHLNRELLPQCNALVQAIAACKDDTVQLDASRLAFVEPLPLSWLSAACEQVGQSGRQVELLRLAPSVAAYLQRMDLFKQGWMNCAAVEVLQSPDIKAYPLDSAANLVELRCLSAVTQINEVSSMLSNAILGQVKQLDQYAPVDEMTGFNDWGRAHEPLCHVFTEVLQNSLTHGRREGFTSSNVWVSAQYYPQTDLIKIGIVDTGCGILASLQHHSKLLNHSHYDAVMLALQPRLSCNRDVGLQAESTNAGIGLTTTRRIVKSAGGAMVIVTGDASVQFVDQADETLHHTPNMLWQGVALGIDLPRSALKTVRIRDLMPTRDFEYSSPAVRFES